MAKRKLEDMIGELDRLVDVGETQRKLTPKQAQMLARACGFGRVVITARERGTAKALAARKLVVVADLIVVPTPKGHEVCRQME